MTEHRSHQGLPLTRWSDPLAMRRGRPSRWGIAPCADIITGSLFTQYQQPDAIYTSPADSSFGGVGNSSESFPVTVGYNNFLQVRYGIPRAFAPLPYDDAGIAFPAGYVRAICGGGARSVYSLFSILTSRHWVDLRIHISGIPAATTGVISINRRVSWDTGAFTTLMFTVNVDGALGATQDLPVTDLLSVPDTIIRQPNSAQFSLQGAVVWTGATPSYVVVTCNPQHVTDAPVVPVSLTGGYTLRTATDATQTPRQINRYDSTLSGVCPDQDAFTADRGTIQGFSGWPSEMAVGAPGFVNVGVTLAPRLGAKPRIFIGDELYQLDWYPASAGTRCFQCPVMTVNVVASTTYDSGWVDFTTLTAAPATRAVGSGFRNARIGGFFSSGAATISYARLSIRISGVTVYGPTDISSLLASTNYVDVTNVYPATNEQEATIELRLEVQATGVGAVFGNIAVQLSPRIDVPMPSSIAGGDNLYAEGGYYASLISIPAPSYDIVHLAAGVTSDAGDASKSYRWVTYTVPTKGYWRIHRTGFPTSSLTLGSYPVGGKFASGVSAGSLCVAGSRIWSTPAGGTVASTLLAITRTGIVMAAGGTTMSGANLSPSGYGFFFGEIACPAAGTYRVWLDCTARRPNAELWASLTDQWCTDSTAVSWRGGDINHRLLLPTLVTATVPPGAPAGSYLIGTGATGIWSGRVGMVAVYFSLLGGYKYLDPARGDVLDAFIDGVRKVYNNGVWDVAATSKMACVIFTVSAAQTVYVRCCTPEKRGYSPEDAPPAISVYWEAL